MAQQIQFRRDSAANWTSANPILAEGEMGLELDTDQFKLGNGVDHWADLPYGGIAGPSTPLAVANGIQGSISGADKAKLDGIEAGATANSSDAALRARSSHTGTQTASTISDFNTAADARVAQHSALTNNPHSVTKVQIGLGSVDNTADASKPVSTAQMAADSAVQSYAIQRANHTGSQPASTISDFAAAADARAAITSTPVGHIGTGGSSHAQVVAGISDGFMLAADKTKLDALPTGPSLTTSLSGKVDKSGDTMTGALNMPAAKINGTAGNGFMDFDPQSVVPATPVQGFRMYAGSTGRVVYKGTNGFPWVLDALAITALRVYTMPDATGTLMIDPATTAGDILYRNGSNVTTRLPIGTEDAILRVASGLPSWQPENLTQDFGDASDGNLTVTGTLTLSQIPYYDKLTISGAGTINTNGYPIYCRTLDLSNAGANAIQRNGNTGTSVGANTGGAAGATLANAVLGGSGAGSVGAAGQSNAGLASVGAATQSPANGGQGGNSGASGAGGTGAGVAAGAGGTAALYSHLGRFEYQFMRNASLILGGAGGDGGNSGGGDGANTSRGAGGGGGGGAVVVIYAANIITTGSTAAGAISAKGGNGGSQTNPPAGGSCGGASGAGGGAGGYIYVAYVTKTGAAVSSLLDASGGTGGNGSNGSGTGVGGAGGQGGGGGNIQTYNVTTGLGVQLIGAAAGSTGTAASGTTGGVGGNGGSAVLAL